MRRSMLFLPGNTPNMLINGNCLGSDAIIFDLEDAVSPAEKDAARILVRNTLRYMDFTGCQRIVRINSTDTAYWKADLDAILPEKPDLAIDAPILLTSPDDPGYEDSDEIRAKNRLDGLITLLSDWDRVSTESTDYEDVCCPFILFTC